MLLTDTFLTENSRSWILCCTPAHLPAARRRLSCAKDRSSHQTCTVGKSRYISGVWLSPACRPKCSFCRVRHTQPANLLCLKKSENECHSTNCCAFRSYDSSFPICSHTSQSRKRDSQRLRSISCQLADKEFR